VSIVGSDKLILTGRTLLYGTLNGAGTIAVGNAVAVGLLVGGSATFAAGGTVTQTGTITIGDTSASAATLSILDGGVWDMGGGSIARGAASGSKIVDHGLLLKNAGSGLAAVGLVVFDDAAVEVATGTLDFTNFLFGTGLLWIDAGARLEADSSAISTLSANFNGTGATLALKAPARFAATISGFAATDVLDLLGIKASGASVNTSDQLVIVNGAKTVASLQLAGNYTGAAFSTGSDGAGGTDIKLISAAGAGPSSRHMVAAMAGMILAPGAAVRRPDPCDRPALVLARPSTSFE
jgi:hypothetical protein